MIDVDIIRKLDGASGAIDLHFAATIGPGELVTIYGPSGAGKTSVLRMIAGLLKPDGGHIKIEDEVWFDNKKGINRSPQARHVGMVFQEYSLFPNMTVRGNLEFALEKGQSRDLVDELLSLTELDQLQDKRPTLLSGGQKQRVALARALIRRPRVLLLDEPLSALDTAMQLKLQDYILHVHKKFSLTTVLVSHDLIEVVKMSRRVLVLEEGRVIKAGAPLDVLPVGDLRVV